MASGDIVMLLDKQFYGTSVEVINRYFYQVSVPASGSGEAEAVADAFVADVLPSILDIQTTNMTHYEIEARNLNNPTDFHSILPIAGNVGLAGAEALPPYACYTFKFVRASLASRHGWKRIAGIYEVDQSNGVATGANIGDLNVLAGNMLASLSEVAGTGVFVPRIVRLTYTGGAITSVQAFPIANVIYSHIGTQNTRKFGRGS